MKHSIIEQTSPIVVELVATLISLMSANASAIKTAVMLARVVISLGWFLVRISHAVDSGQILTTLLST